MPEKSPPKQFVPCVFCALLRWSEEQRQEYIAGSGCFMKSPRLVAELLSSSAYAEAWPLIPREELDASAVALPHHDREGQATTTLVLMHKRRVTPASLAGEEPAWVCTDCYNSLKWPKPKMPKYALANFNWLGRHPPEFKDTTLGHQLLLPLGRVVSTKVYLSSKGRGEAVRQHSAA